MVGGKTPCPCLCQTVCQNGCVTQRQIIALARYGMQRVCRITGENNPWRGNPPAHGRPQWPGKALAVKWAEEQAAGNAWFKKVWDHQRAYEKLWEDAASYRNVKYK